MKKPVQRPTSNVQREKNVKRQMSNVQHNIMFSGILPSLFVKRSTLNVNHRTTPGCGFRKPPLYYLFMSSAVMAFILLVPSVGLAWFGLELNAGLTARSDPYEAAEGGEGGLWDLSGRAMFSESSGAMDAEIHWLAAALGSFGDQPVLSLTEPSPFRSLDLEDIHYRSNRSGILSELDRLSLAFRGKNIRLSVGRQAVSWGEAYYYNIGDLFGAFPVTETNRLYKPGIDALTVAIDLGPFSGLSAVLVPSREGKDNQAARALFPLGSGSLTLTAASVLEDELFGAGYTLDVRGTKVYATGLVTDPDQGKDFSECVLGAERQTGPYTRVAGEVYFNGWGASARDDYPDLLLSDRFLEGRPLALGRWNMSLEVNRQVSPLMILTPALFANLSDGSALLRMNGSYSASDLTTVSGGLSFGFGKRPDGPTPQSEFGGMPPTLFLEMVHSL